MAPMLYPPNITIPTNGTNSTSGNSSSTNATNNPFNSELLRSIISFSQIYGNFSNFTHTNLSTANPLSLFLPKHCKGVRNEADTPLIGISAP